MGRFVHLGFLMAALVIAAMSLLLNGALTTSHETSQSLFRSYHVLNTLHALQDDYKGAENAAMSYARTHDPAAMAKQKEMLERAGAGIASLKTLTQDNLAQQQRLRQLESRLGQRITAFNASRQHQAGKRSAIGDDNMFDSPAWDEREAFFSSLGEMEAEELRIFKERGQTAQYRFSIAQKTLAVVLAIGLLLLAGVYFSWSNQMRARRRAEQLEKESSSMLRMTIDSVRGMMVYVDRNLRYKLHNKAYAELMGDAERSFVGTRVGDVLGPKLFDTTKALIDQALAGEAVQGERKHVQADGSVVDIQINYAPHFGESGEVLGFFGMLTDITEFKRKEMQLVETSVFQRTILDSAHIAIIATDKDGVIRLFNVGAERMLGYSASEVIGNVDFSPVRFHDQQEVADRAAALSHELGVDIVPDIEAIFAKARRGVADENEWTYRRKDGSTIPVFVSVTVLRTEQGAIIGYLDMAFDITQRKETETLLKQARADAVQSSRAKSAFLATMSHEIRTPMNGVVGMVEVLAHSRLSDYQADMVQTIGDSASVLLNLIDDILDFSKIEANRLSLELVPLSIADLLDAVCSSLLPVAHKMDVELKLFVSPLLPHRVLADQIRLRQVLYNLIGNALKFSVGRPGACVWVRTEVTSSAPLRVAFSIIDNGIGMGPETVSQLFTPFMQAEASTTRRFGGTGLGLTICKRLVALMRGELGVTSTVGQGSAFTVILPFELAPAEPEPASPLPDLHGINCIVQQGDDLNAGDLRVYLEAAGARVIVATHAEAAAAAAQWAQPLVLIQDGKDEPRARRSIHALFANAPQVRHLLLTRGVRQQLRLGSSGVVSLDSDALQRGRFLRAVQVAAGRALVETDQHCAPDPIEKEHAAPLSVAEARAQCRLILVAEDNVINQKVILRQLELLGHTAEVAGSGMQALQQWRAGGYALLLTDLHMPQLDGYGLTAAIRTEELAGRRLPILVLTANALRDEATRARAAGVDEYLVKPVSLAVLGAALDKWLPRSPPRPVLAAIAAPPILAQTAAVDIEVLIALVGNDAAVLRELLAEYLVAARQMGAQLGPAYDAGDTATLGAIAHKLKSSSRAVGALALGDACAALELASQGQRNDGIVQSLADLKAALTPVEVALAGLLAEEK